MSWATQFCIYYVIIKFNFWTIFRQNFLSIYIPSIIFHLYIRTSKKVHYTSFKLLSSNIAWFVYYQIFVFVFAKIHRIFVHLS